MEGQKKNNSFLYLAIIVILLMALSGLGGYIIADKISNNESNNSNASEKENNNQQSVKITDAEKKEILDIIGLTENGYPKESYNDSKANAGLNTFNFQGIMTGITKTGDIKVDDLSDEIILSIIFNYANKHNMLGSVTETEYCEAGKGSCESLSFADYNKISKIYGITKDGKSLFSKDTIYKNNYYLFNNGGTFDIPVTMTDSVSFVSEKDSIQVIYKLKYTDEEGTKNKDQIYTYTFKKDTSNNFCLDTINIKNN